jgi:hypothetical protein
MLASGRSLSLPGGDGWLMRSRMYSAHFPDPELNVEWEMQGGWTGIIPDASFVCVYRAPRGMTLDPSSHPPKHDLRSIRSQSPLIFLAGYLKSCRKRSCLKCSLLSSGSLASQQKKVFSPKPAMSYKSNYELHVSIPMTSLPCPAAPGPS